MQVLYFVLAAALLIGQQRPAPRDPNPTGCEANTGRRACSADVRPAASIRGGAGVR
jgi:hypothetical protein